MAPFTLGVVTDEIDADLQRACRIAAELGMGVVELNTVWDKPADQLQPAEVAQAAGIIGGLGLRIDAVGTLALKALELSTVPVFAHSAAFAAHLAAIRRAARVARALGPLCSPPAVRIFSFRREPMVGLGNPWPILPDGGGLPEATLERIAEGLSLACDLAREEGVRLLVENVRSCWGNSGVHTARIVAATARPELGIIWDVANDYVACGRPYHEGYAAVAPWMEGVHVKDARVVDSATGLTAWVRVGDGAVDIQGQLAALWRSGFSGPVLLETHWRGEGLDREASTRRSFAGLRAALERGEAASAAP
jgi:sugar phosphate isomerase/epimerase